MSNSKSKETGGTASGPGASKGMPDESEIYSLIGLCNQGRFEEASYLAEAVTTRFPRFAFGWKLRGVVLCQLGRTADSIAPLRKAVSLEPRDHEAYFNLGNALKELNRLDEAVTCFRKALAIDPTYGEAHGNLGVTLQLLGRYEDGLASLRRAADLLPSAPGVQYNLGNAFADLGRNEEAIEAYRRAVVLAPNYLDAHVGLGTALLALRWLDESVSEFNQAIALDKDHPEARCKLGDALLAKGNPTEAERCYRRALGIRPLYAEAHNSLGIALQDLGQLDAAIASHRRALQIRPDYCEAHYNLGSALQKVGQFAEASESLRAALAIRPNFAEAYNNLGHSLHYLGRLEESEASFRRALECRPDFLLAQINLGAMLQELGRFDDAVASCYKALEVDPNYADAHFNLGNALRDLGRPEEAVASYRRALETRPDHPEANSNLQFVLSFHALVSPAELLTEARRWGERVISAEARSAARSRRFSRRAAEGRRLRIGYVSGDYRQQHPVSHFVEPLFRAHDRSRVELFAYSSHMKEDDFAIRLRGVVDHWSSIAGVSDEDVRRRMDEDEIDILVDLSGHSAHNRLGVFALRSAPVQAHYLGYFGTTGLAEMDYWIGDPVITPAADDVNYSERIWRLPRVWIGYQGRADALSPAWRPAEDGTLWLGSFNNLYKLTPATLALWAKVLGALPESKLLLKTKGLGTPDGDERIRRAFAALNIDAERLCLIGRTEDWASHMALYDRLDVALDPVGGAGGGTTTCDALWMGVPVVTLCGMQMPKRMTASMLDAIGHGEWIAESEAEYVDKVVSLARNRELRTQLRAEQRDAMRKSALCDLDGLARSLESAYEAMFEAWWRTQHAPAVQGEEAARPVSGSC